MCWQLPILKHTAYLSFQITPIHTSGALCRFAFLTHYAVAYEFDFNYLSFYITCSSPYCNPAEQPLVSS